MVWGALSSHLVLFFPIPKPLHCLLISKNLKLTATVVNRPFDDSTKRNCWGHETQRLLLILSTSQCQWFRWIETVNSGIVSWWPLPYHPRPFKSHFQEPFSRVHFYDDNFFVNFFNKWLRVNFQYISCEEKIVNSNGKQTKTEQNFVINKNRCYICIILYSVTYTLVTLLSYVVVF